MKQEAIKVKILMEYSNIPLIEMIPILENYYKFLNIHQLENMFRLIKKISALKDADIGKFTLYRLFEEYPFFLLTQTSTNQYILFLRIITGNKNL